MSTEPAQNTDRELWRKTDDYYSPSLHVTEGGGIGINVGGTVIVKPIEEWHALASQPSTPVAAQGQEMPAPDPHEHLVGLFNIYTRAKRGLTFSKRWFVVNAMEKAMIAAEAGVAASQPTTDKEK